MNVPPPPPPSSPPPPPPPSYTAVPSSAAPAGGYPALLTVTSPERISNWRPLVQWLMAIPHFIVMYALGIVAQV